MGWSVFLCLLVSQYCAWPHPVYTSSKTLIFPVFFLTTWRRHSPPLPPCVGGTNCVLSHFKCSLLTKTGGSCSKARISHLIDTGWLLWWCHTGESAGQAGIRQWAGCPLCSLRSRRPYKAADGSVVGNGVTCKTNWPKGERTTSSSRCNRSGSCSRPCWMGSWGWGGSLFDLNRLGTHTLNASYLMHGGKEDVLAQTQEAVEH